MTRIQQAVSSRSSSAGAASVEAMSLRRVVRRARRRIARRELLALPVALALIVPAAPALAQTTGTSGYGEKPPAPKTTPTKTEPKKAAEPSKTTSTTPTTPSTAAEPTKTEPTTTTPAAKAAALPFTGLNLTWVVGAGLLLLCAGLAIRLGQRTRAGG